MPPHTSDSTRERYRPDIDGLRAVAILGVVAYHVGIPGITGGFSGVDVFFVISGYLITQLLARELTTTGTLSIGNFYARRMRRLLPALVLVVLATLALSWVLPPANVRSSQNRHWLRSYSSRTTSS
jgi:peptidoglycan/LPS O-acetylase OafA/YrhL